MNVHYHKTTGEIMMFDQHHDRSPHGSHFANHLIAFIPGNVKTVNAKTHRVNVVSKTLVEKTTAEQKQAHLPDILEVKHVIAHELHHSDSYMVCDRPITDEALSAWKKYRQELRRLSDLSTPVDMIKSWPSRPDNVDAISELRKRI